MSSDGRGSASRAPARAAGARTKFFARGDEELWSARTDALSADDPVVLQCAALEARAWTAREPFGAAYRRSDHLVWAARGDAVCGFLLVSSSPVAGDAIGFSIDEAMVDPDHLGEHVISRVFWSAACGVTALAAARGARRIVFFALTSSPRLIAAFYKYRFLLPDHSFSGKPWLERAASAYLARRGLDPLDGKSFWARAAFPSGLHATEPDVPHLPLPPGFDPRTRGDAFLMVGAIPTAIARPIVLARHAILFRNVLGRHVVLPW
jgi:hypothetical protein